jgi:putative membrane protein
MGLWCSQTSAGAVAATALLLAAVVGLAVWAVCRLFPVQRTPDPLMTLDARLAAGDIDPKTYLSIREQIDGHASATKGPR